MGARPDGRWYSEGWKEIDAATVRVLTSTADPPGRDLGNRQQFVAYHIHPDTGAPYGWVDLLGGLEHMRADELPVLTESRCARRWSSSTRWPGYWSDLQGHPVGQSMRAPREPSERTPAAEG